jgi:hypothetical protein
MMRPASLLLSLLVVLFAPVIVDAATATFSDGTFLDANWTTTVEVKDGGGTASGFQVGSGGNPGAFRQTNISLNSSSGSQNNGVWISHRMSGATFNPSLSGAIVSISYSEASLLISTVQACGIAIRQGGVIYYGPSFLDTYSWSTTTQPALTAANFDALPAGVQNPNFSNTGGAIEFGFYRANSTGVGSFGYSTQGGIDNWSVTVTYNGPVATEPTAWGKVKALYR